MQTALPSLLGGIHHTHVKSQLVELLKSLKPQFASRLEGRTSGGAVADTHGEIQVATLLIWDSPSLHWENYFKILKEILKRKKKKKQTPPEFTSHKSSLFTCVSTWK